MCLLCPPVCLEPFSYYVGKSEWIDSVFFCMKTKKHGARWASFFTAGTAVINIIINIWLLVNVHYLEGYLEDNEKWNFIPPGILPLLYIEFIFNVILFCMAFVLMIGVNRGFQGKGYMYTWIWVFSAFRWYEVFLGIYILVWLGSHRIPDVVFMFPQINLIAVYWIINTVIMVWCMITVSSYYKECNRQMYGKEKRVRYFKMLSNIRSAALSKTQSMFSGTATPRSMYMSHGNMGPGYSQGSIGPGYSQGSLSQASYPVKQPRSHLPSTASSIPSQRGYPSHSGYPPPNAPSAGGDYPPPRGGSSSGGGGYAPAPVHGGYMPPAMAGVQRPQPQYAKPR